MMTACVNSLHKKEGISMLLLRYRIYNTILPLAPEPISSSTLSVHFVVFNQGGCFSISLSAEIQHGKDYIPSLHLLICRIIFQTLSPGFYRQSVQRSKRDDLSVDQTSDL